ncbi:hypothetical protein DSL72_006317 [Monilinia vaccinii-corymbosi]|uniref:Uncharacterized protein n=1 Tax=Monilinia vaccinii-corymbosi TaxID=61207 RepID=A0A8A3PM45_9HELO|nr:hypothetical protein DSL72_006317 [Monilinia vaccinii-corymbosi]
MPSRRFGRPAMVVATLIAFSVLTLVFIGEGFKAFVRKDGASLGKRDIIFGLNWQTTIFTPFTAGGSDISTSNDCSPDSSNIPPPLINHHSHSQKQAIEAGSTTISAILAQGTNTASLALQGRSDMVFVILANINRLVTHPTGVSNTVRDASGLLAIAMAKSNPSDTKAPATYAATPTDLHSFAAFELLKKAATYSHQDSHGESCDCAACNPSPAAPILITAAPPLPTHELIARALGARAETATVTVTVTFTDTVCEDEPPKTSSSTGPDNQIPTPAPAPASNTTSSGPKNPVPASQGSNLTSSGPSGPKNPPPASNLTPSGPNNPAPAPDNSNPTSPSRPNPPFVNGTDTGSGGATTGSGSSGSGAGSGAGSGPSGSGAGSGSSGLGSGSGADSGAGGAASASGAVASAASLFSGNSSQPTGYPRPSNNPGSKSPSASKPTPADNTSPVQSAGISPPIASQASAASSGIDNSIFSVITPALSNVVYIIWTIAPIAGMVVMGQIWLL